MAASYSAAPGGDVNTDLGTMWQEALIKYYEECGTDLRTIHPSRFTATHILAEQDHQLLLFNQFRHDKGKLDKLRSLIASNSEIIQGVASHIAEAASAAFPPSAAILTAFNYVLNASKVVSEDYDLIVSFFDIMNSFLERVSILENRMPNEWQFKKFLVNVFSSMLTLSAIARKCRQKGRLSKWAKALIDGSDPKLKGAFDSLHMHLERFESATMLATLRHTMETSKKVDGLGQDVKSIQAGVEQNLAVSQKNYMLGLETKGLSKDAALTSHEILTVVTRQEDRGAEHAAGLQQVLSTLKKISGTKNAQETVLDAGSRKSAAMRTLAKLLSCSLDDDPAKAQLLELENTYIKGTYGWFREHEVYSGFESGTSPVVAISSPSGMGKSTLSYTIIKALQEEFVGDSTTSVAYHFFREDVDDMATATRMLRACAVQVASDDVKYREEVLSDLQLSTYYTESEATEELVKDHEQLWLRFYKKRFTKKSGRRLIMVLDGVDEADRASREIMETILGDLCSSKDLNIHILYTCDPAGFQVDTEVVPVTEFALTKEHLLPDMKKIIINKIKTLSRLRKLSQKTKKKIVVRLTKQADTIRYVDHMLRKLNQIGREKPVLRELDSLPSSTTDLYRVLLADCQKSRSDQDIAVLRKFFAWLAYSKMPLSLGAAGHLLHYIAQDNNISIDEELDHRCARLLRLSNSNQMEGSGDEDSDSENDKLDDEKINDNDDDSVEDLKVMLSFQERSLRNYFRPGTSSSDDKLRSAHSSGHAMILEMLHSILAADVKANDQTPAQWDLTYYAAQHWVSHLQEIDSEQLTQEEVVSTIDAVCGILSNRGGSIRLIERCYLGDDLKSCILGDDEEAIEKFLQCLQKWAVKATQLPASAISGGTLAWMKPFARNPKSIYIKIADAHVANWLTSYDLDQDFLVHRRFVLAHYALYLGRELPAIRQNERLRLYLETLVGQDEFVFTKESVLTISQAFLHIDMTSQSYRAIGTSMLSLELREEALEQFKLGTENADSHLDSFNILVKMADATLTIAKEMLDAEEAEQEAAAEKTSAKGATVSPATANGTAGGAQNGGAATTNGHAEEADGAKEGAPKKTSREWSKESLETCDRAIEMIDKIAPADLKTYRVRDAIYELWHEKSQGELYLGNATNVVEYSRKAREAVGEEGGSILLPVIIRRLAKLGEWAKLVEALRSLCCNKYDTWYYITEVADEIHQAAKETGEFEFVVDMYRTCSLMEGAQLWSFTVMHGWASFYQEVIGTKDAIIKAKAILNKVVDVNTFATNITQASFRLANILLEEFRTSREPANKLAAYREMQDLVKRVSGVMGSDFDPTQSQTVIPLALMMRKLDAYEYQQSLERMFSGCVAALTDDVAWNDKYSLRTLAKTLAVVGLADDARIAGTCQIYITDKEVHKKQRTDSVDSGQAGDAAAETSAGEGADASAETSATGQSIASEEPAKQENGGGAAAEVNGERKEDDDGASEELSDDIDPIHGALTCDGCNKVFSDWNSGPLYLCYYCTELDLCQKCFDQRSDRFSGKLPPDWRTICPEGHQHIQAPVDDWKGLRNGVLRFGDQELVFSEWLIELKEKKWPEAWERFWNSESV